MTDNEVGTLTRKIDKVFGIVGEVKESVALLTERTQNHLDSHDHVEEQRAITCPTAAAVRSNKSDIDGLAGVVRSMRECLDKKAKEGTWWKRLVSSETVRLVFVLAGALLIAKYT